MKTMKILVIDNYDSFTYNLVQYLEELCKERVTVARNDEISIAEASEYDKILLSPGPGIPSGAGILKSMVGELGPAKSILGICLGMQAIAEVYGGELKNLDETFHGVATKIFIDDENEVLFKGLPLSFMAGRYHSWIAERSTLPPCLKVIASDSQKIIMGLRHASYDVCGVQFHPESILTEYGKQILANWLFGFNTEFEIPVLPSSKDRQISDKDAFSKSIIC